MNERDRRPGPTADPSGDVPRPPSGWRAPIPLRRPLPRPASDARGVVASRARSPPPARPCGVSGLGILGLLLASLFVPGLLFEGLGVRPATGRETLELGMRMVMVIGIAAVPLAFVVLSPLRAIVDTVRDGDPFVAANARRLQTIAWAYLGIELLHIAVGVVAASSGSSAQPLDVDWSFSFTPWVAVLLLFVLARVFDHGARTRRWAHLSELLVIDAWILVFYLGLIRAGALPRLLSAFGLLTVAAHVVAIPLPGFLGLRAFAEAGMPMALSHLATAGWLVAKGSGPRSAGGDSTPVAEAAP